VNVNMSMDPADTCTEHTTVFPNNFMRGDDPRASVDTTKDKVDRLKTARYIAKNTARCYYNGDCVYKYNKIGDFYEVPEQNPDTIMVPNRGSKVSGTSVRAGRSSVAGGDFGISICHDQSLSVTRRCWSSSAANRGTSSWQPNPRAKCTPRGAGGYRLALRSTGRFEHVDRPPSVTTRSSRKAASTRASASPAN
jgi:hypothetical protein